MKTMRALFIILLLLTGTGLIAQQKYEYASVAHMPTSSVTYRLVITSDNGCDVIEGKKNVMNSSDLTPAFKKVKEMEDMGWELFDTQMASAVQGLNMVYFFMRKKRN